ncbi:MAG: hypothetical protein QXR18_04615 [Pyrobaculum sp.]
MKLHTPGHGLLADTLIMHGIVRLLAEMEIYTGAVEREGERYVVEINNGYNLSKAKEAESVKTLLQEIDAFPKIKERVRNLMLGKLYDANINPGVFDTWLEDLRNGLGQLDLNVYQGCDHKSKYNVYQHCDHKSKYKEGKSKYEEGKSSSRKLKTVHLTTVYLTFTPIFGKYNVENYIVNEGNYRVCSTCFSLLNLGLLFGVATLVRRGRNERDVVLLTAAPVERVELDELLILQRLTEGSVEINNDIPTAAAPLLWLSVGETLYALDSKMELLVWRVQKAGNNQRAVDYVVTDLSRLLEFVSVLKWHTPRWPRCAESLVDTGNAYILAEMTNYALFGGDYYRISRELATTVDNREEARKTGLINCEVDKITEALIRLAQTR